MKKKIFASMFMIALMAALVGGATFAYFNDTETSTGNSFAAGTLDLKLDGGDDNVVKFTASNLAPGQSGKGTWTIRNAGNINGFVDLTGITVVNTGATPGTSEFADGSGDLGANMNVRLFIDANGNGDYDTGDTEIYNGPLNSIASDYNLNLPLNSGETKYIGLAWNIPGTVGNSIQGDSVSFSMTFSLEQIAD
ncbi:MAG: TasA family protein [Desulfotomaculales bacterium]